jgi:hypothetical protein
LLERILAVHAEGDVPRAVENGRRSGGELKIHELGFEVNDSA